jgi:hypothetical protein
MAQQSAADPFKIHEALVMVDGVASGTSPNTPLGTSYQTTEFVLATPVLLLKDVRYYILVW